METNTRYCQEPTGLFIIRDCTNSYTNTCEKCNKTICEQHSFNSNGIALSEDTKQNAILCLSCISNFDTRLTKEIELYSKDRAIWRKKMMERFHTEYPFMQFVAEDYGSLFDTTSTVFFGHDNEDSYFDS